MSLQNKIRPLLLVTSLLILVSVAVFPMQVNAQIPVSGNLNIGLSSPFPANPVSLSLFIQEVTNGAAQEITGLYISNLFSYPVIQQPDNQPAYVSPEADRVTQFQSASSFGSLGFVAHNTLAGMKFPEINAGNLISVVYGDGHYRQYQVRQIRTLQAVQPNNPYSSFIDLSTHQLLSVEDVFYQTYGVKNQLILQTCISYQGLELMGALICRGSPLYPNPLENRYTSYLGI